MNAKSLYQLAYSITIFLGVFLKYGKRVTADFTNQSYRMRFSLRTLGLMIALVALIVTVAMMYRELAPLREEVRRLRNEAGILEVSDESRVHAIGVETYQQKAWKWRIWCPKGERVFVKLATAHIPEQARGNQPLIGTATGQLEINRRNAVGAEVEVSLAPEKNLDGTVRWNLREGGVIKHLRVPDDASDWLLKGCDGWSGGGTMTRTTSKERDQPLQLLWLRAQYRDAQTVTNPTTDGIMAWIETEGED